MLKLPPRSMVHPVFHVSLLKKCLSPQVQSQLLPNFLAEDWELKLKPAKILVVWYATTGEKEVLVKWQDLPAFETSWESARDINTNFPHLHLEDKVNVYEGSIDRQHPNQQPKQTLIVYERRRNRNECN